MIENKEALGAIILAGGNGERFQGKKQFYVINGKPLWRHVYDKIQTVLENNNIVVVGVENDISILVKVAIAFETSSNLESRASLSVIELNFFLKVSISSTF